VTQLPIRARMRYDVTSIAVAQTRGDELPGFLRRALRLPV